MTWEYQKVSCDFCCTEWHSTQLETVLADRPLRMQMPDGVVVDLNRHWLVCEDCLPLATAGKWSDLAERVTVVDEDHMPVEILLQYWGLSFR